MTDRIEETTDESPPAEASAETAAPVAEASEPAAASPAKKPRKPRAPRPPRDPNASQSAKPKVLPPEAVAITLETRLKHGYLTVNECCALAMCGRSSLYLDARKGLLDLRKKGGRRRAFGPDFMKYLSAKSGE
jgi:hypothetical protein